MALTTINSGGVKDDSIVNADIKSDAAIAGSKINPTFTTAASITAAQPQLQFQDSDGTNQITEVSNSSGHTYIKTRNNTGGGNFYVNTWDNTNSNYPTLFTILNGGNVGIGDTTPGYKLEVDAGTTDVVASFTSSDANAWIQFRDDDTTDTAVMIGANDDSMKLRAGSNTRMVIESDGDFRLSGGDAATNYGWIRGWQDATGDMIIGADQSATGTGTSKSNLIFRSRGSEKMRIDSSGRILIGHDETTDVAGIEAALQVTGTTSDNSSLTLSRFSVDDWCSFLTFSKSRNGTKGNQTACTSNERLGQILWTGSDGTDTANSCAEITAKSDGNFSSNNCPTKLEFGVNAGGTSSTTYLTIKPGGNVEVNDGNLVLANGHGIDFSATSDAGGMASELLDDYESGTWTAAVSTGTCSQQSCNYTKVGNLVHIWGRIHGLSDTTTNIILKITGLPYTCNTSNAGGSKFSKDISTDANTSYVNTNEELTFYGHNSANAWSYVTHLSCGANTEIYFHASYTSDTN